MTFPTNPTAGQRHQEPSGIWYSWKDCGGGVGAWEQDRSQLTYYDPIPLGAIQAFTIGTAPNGWLLCDGSAFDQTTYPELFAVLGTTTLPDLRGEFLRGRKAGQAIGSHIDWTTGRPKTALTGVTSTAGAHTHNYISGWGNRSGIKGGDFNNGEIGYGGHTNASTSNGDHNHTVTIDGGGDAETAPDHTLVDFYIKASHAKINLPNAGFLTHATTLKDGDIWQFDAVSNTFINVPASTLVSGMTVGAVPPTKPFNGQQWMLNAGPERGLKIYDATDADPANHGWLDADRNPVLYVGSGAFNAGTVTEAGNWGMPANTVPSPKSVMPQPDDQYLDVSTGIFKRLTGPALPAGGATPASPIDSSITGATQIGDVTPRVPTYQRIVGDQYTTSEHIIELTQNCTEWIEMWGFVQCGVNFTAIPRVKFAGAMWDFTDTNLNQHSFSISQYTSDGVSDNTNGYLTTHKAGFCYRNTANYDARENHPLLFTLKATRMGSYWMFRISSTFQSGNDTPMTFSSGWQTTKNANITGIGVTTYNYQGTAEQPGPYGLNVSYL